MQLLKGQWHAPDLIVGPGKVSMPLLYRPLSKTPKKTKWIVDFGEKSCERAATNSTQGGPAKFTKAISKHIQYILQCNVNHSKIK